MGASAFSPWWRRWLQRNAHFLFIVCAAGNYHWLWEKTCYCNVGMNGRTSPERLA